MGSHDKNEISMVVLGSEGVGKSSLCLRFTQDSFPDDHDRTLWSDTYEKWVHIGKKKKQRTKLIITDTAGQEEMVALLDTHLQNKDTVLLVISLTDQDSLIRAARIFDYANKYFSNRRYMENKSKGPMPILIACNKCDLLDTDPSLIKFDKEKIKETCSVQDSQIIYTSAKTSIKVTEAFTKAIELIPGAVAKSQAGCRIS